MSIRNLAFFSVFALESILTPLSLSENFQPSTSPVHAGHTRATITATRPQPSSLPSPSEPSHTTAFHPTYGYGVVDAARAVSQAQGEAVYPAVANRGGVDWGVELINAPEAWQQGHTGQDVIVAVIDTGVDYTHPDLQANIWVNQGEIAGNGRDDDGNGYVDDMHGYDFVDQDAEPMDETSRFNRGHGTHVAGAIAAQNNTLGMTGVAPDAQIMVIRVLDKFSKGTGEQIATGIRYATANGADVINLSLGFYSPKVDAAIHEAKAQGITVVMAAGNEAMPQPAPPADLAQDAVGIAVGAINARQELSPFSNRAGAKPIRYVVAPGVDIYSTLPGNTYTKMAGTSMATPYVSGVVAIIKGANPDLTPDEIMQLIIESADPM